MNAWGYWTLEEYCVAFTGGPYDLKNYLGEFYMALQYTAPQNAEQWILVQFCEAQEAELRKTNGMAAVIEHVYYVDRTMGRLTQYAPQAWLLETGGASIRATLYQNWRERKDVLNQALRDAVYEVLKGKNMHLVHAACVVCPWGTALIFGESGAGKSTMALALGTRGCQIVSDDKCVVTANGVISSLGFPITFRAGTGKLIPSLEQYERGVPASVFQNADERYRYKIAVDYEEIVGNKRIYHCTDPYHIVLLERTAQDEYHWESIDKSFYALAVKEYANEIDSPEPGSLFDNAVTVSRLTMPVAKKTIYQNIVGKVLTGL